MRIEGIVSSGLGRAHIFMSQHHYQEQFKAIIGRSAWPGTLNVHVEGTSLIEYKNCEYQPVWRKVKRVV